MCRWDLVPGKQRERAGVIRVPVSQIPPAHGCSLSLAVYGKLAGGHSPTAVRASWHQIIGRAHPGSQATRQASPTGIACALPLRQPCPAPSPSADRKQNTDTCSGACGSAAAASVKVRSVPLRSAQWVRQAGVWGLVRTAGHTAHPALHHGYPSIPGRSSRCKSTCRKAGTAGQLLSQPALAVVLRSPGGKSETSKQGTR